MNKYQIRIQNSESKQKLNSIFEKSQIEGKCNVHQFMKMTFCMLEIWNAILKNLVMKAEQSTVTCSLTFFSNV